MASSNKTTSSLALFFCLNLLFFSLVTARSPCSEPVPEPNQSPNSVVTPPTTGSGPVVGLPTDGAPSPTTSATCPRNLADISACATLLSTLSISFGVPPPQKCCSLIQGLANLEAAVCLCTSVKLSVGNVIDLNIPVWVSLLLNSCTGNNAPSNYQCA